MDVRLDCEESWAPKNWCFWTAVLEKTLESPLDCKEIQPVHPKGDQSWVYIGRTDAELKLQYFGHLMGRVDSNWKRPWCWKQLAEGGKVDGVGWDGWMASPNRWTWVCVNYGSWWWTGMPGVLRFMGSQSVGHDWATELNCTEPSKGLVWMKQIFQRIDSIGLLIPHQFSTVPEGAHPLTQSHIHGVLRIIHLRWSFMPRNPPLVPK